MAKKTIKKELIGAQDLYNFLFEACNIIRGPVSQDNFKDYITPLLYYKRISDVYDEETGLYYLQSRYYDPLTGRFLNADVYCDTESGTPLSTNMFAYCENNAINNVDYSGNSPKSKNIISNSYSVLPIDQC